MEVANLLHTLHLPDLDALEAVLVDMVSTALRQVFVVAFVAAILRGFGVLRCKMSHTL